MAATLTTFKKDMDRMSDQRLQKKDYPKELTLVAEGDSWFDYPLKKDILDHLRKMGYAIKKFSKAGDTLENMIYGSDYEIKGNEVYPKGPISLQETLNAIRKHQPRFVLFSAGGNDVVGTEIMGYLHHKYSNPNSLVNKQVFQEKLLQMKSALVYFIESVHTTYKHCDILMDGYDYAKVNGKGYNFIIKNLKGPWILPAMGQKAISLKKDQNAIIKYLVDEFNAMLEQLSFTYPYFHYLNFRGMFKDEREWHNDIHLHNAGYRKVANKYHEKMTELLQFNPLQRFEKELLV